MAKTNETWVRGQKFDDFLKEQGIYEKTVLLAEFEVLVELITEFIQTEKISKAEFGKLVLSQLELIGGQLNSEIKVVEAR